jgi:hypothetical protein
MARDIVKLSIGEYRVDTPSLEGWRYIFEAVPSEDVERLFNLGVRMVNGDIDEDAAVPELMPVLRKAPGFVQAACAAVCVNALDGGRSTPEEFRNAKLADVTAVFAAVIEGDLLADLLGELKNVASLFKSAKAKSRLTSE